jgi:hypothetical protein
MGVTRTGSHDDGTIEAPTQEKQALSPTDAHEHPADALTPVGASPDDPPTSQIEAPATQLLAGSVGDRCANCGAPLASDQRYCIQCGERRGSSRFSTATMTAPKTAAAGGATGAPPEPRRRWSSGTTLIAGIATLLLAMGVGVLIGKAGNNNNNSRAGTPTVITVNGGGASSGSAGASSGAAGANTGGTSTGTAHHRTAARASHAPRTESAKAKQAASTSKPSAAAVKKASNAASSVLGGSAGQQQSTVTTGSSCQAGTAGCQNGHFSGNFFGP